jgi:NAD(P)-dependent dehydrogenase (short-subunit alcohol dehydrogenase family)
VAVVTGGGTGIGAAIARVLTARGLFVALVGRRAEKLAETAAELTANGGRVLQLPFDLAEPGAAGAVVDAVLSEAGRLDVLVNNAAIIKTGPLSAYALDEIDRHLAVNIRAPILLTQSALPALRRSPDAAIVNVSSSVGSMVKPGNLLYGTTKAALEYFTRAAAYELAGDGIRVNCIAPGPVDTPIHETWADDLQAAYADLARRIPLGRMGEPEDVAYWVWTLVAPESRWTTGNVIHVDGGQVLGLPEAAGG